MKPKPKQRLKRVIITKPKVEAKQAPIPTPAEEKGSPAPHMDAARHICLELWRDTKGVHYVAYDTGQELTLARSDVREFDSQWRFPLERVPDTSPQYLAKRMLNHATLVGVTPVASAYLTAVATTGRVPAEPPTITPTRALPAALKAHQFKKSTTAPPDPTVTLTGHQNGTMREGSLRAQLIVWLKKQKGHSAKLSAITTAFKRDMRGSVAYLADRHAVTQS